MKMIENVDELLKAIGMSSMKEAGQMQEEKKKIKGEIVKLRREIWRVDGEVRWSEGFEDAYKESREAKESKKARAEEVRGEDEDGILGVGRGRVK